MNGLLQWIYTGRSCKELSLYALTGREETPKESKNGCKTAYIFVNCYHVIKSDAKEKDSIWKRY